MKFIEKYKKILPVAALVLVIILSAIFAFVYLGEVKSSLGETEATAKLYTIITIVTASAVILFIAVFAALAFLITKIVSYFTKKIYSDSLTGIANVEMLSKFYKDLKEKAKDYAYVYVHINNFSQVSSTFGYDTGNQLLKDVARCLKLGVKDDEIACHLSSNIYALLLKFESKEQFSKRLEIMLKSLEKLKIKNFNTEIAYACSYRCGVYQIAEDNINFDEIAKMARIAYTATKLENTGAFVFFDDEMQSKIQFRSKLLASAEGAIEQKQIEPYFQPKHNLKDRTVCGVELFARWIHPDFGVITSSDFISVLEATGNILKLDLYMVEEACKLLKKWFDEECMPVPLSVNISKFNLYEPNFVDKVISLVAEYGVPTNLIDFEIDGDSLLGHEDKAFEVAEILRKQGFMITVDNFGRRLIPMELICKQPISMLNISNSFVRRAQESRVMREVLSSIITLAHKLKILVCAIAVETEQQDGFLAEIGCDYGQGNLYSVVIPQAEFEKTIF